MKGTIARLVRDRGFGFIRSEDGKESFFHASGVQGTTFEDLHEGEQVTFELESDPRTGRERATNVTPAS